MKHTPGPWHIYPVHCVGANNSVGPVSVYQVRDKYHRIIARMSAYPDAGATDIWLQKEANAHLLATAPELLEVLTAIFFKWQCNEPGNACVENYNKARDVIRKATEG